MFPVLKERLSAMSESLIGYQYQADHTDLMVILNRKLGQGMSVRLIFDKNNFMESSCVRQAPRMQELFDSGAEMRMLRPPHGGYSCMHVKTLVIDEEVILTGSVNLTHNGLEHNKEHLYCITDPSAVGEVMADFDKEWQDAEKVTEEIIADMMAKYERKQEAKLKAKEERVQRSKSSRSASRSASVEIEEPADGDGFASA